MANYDVFISYASEDMKFASELAGGLKSWGFRVWYADSELEVGNILLNSINHGLTDSTCGVLIVSREFLGKGWTNYEMDILLRQHIEEDKKIFPIWHGVSKKEVEARHPGLASIVALRSCVGLDAIMEKLGRQLAKGAPTVACVPSYESPVWRFTQGYGELKEAASQSVKALPSVVLYIPEDKYPIGVEGKVFTKKALLCYAAESLAVDPSIARRYVRDVGEESIRKQCIEAGLGFILSTGASSGLKWEDLTL